MKRKKNLVCIWKFVLCIYLKGFKKINDCSKSRKFFGVYEVLNLNLKNLFFVN